MNYVVIGASAAGINGIKKLRQLEPNANITLISKDEHIYSRCILHHYLEGIRDVQALSFVEERFIEKNQINWIKGVQLKAIDPIKQELTLSDASAITYDKVLLATGASTFFPPVIGLGEAKNVFGLRNLDDVELIKARVNVATHIVVMGAGLVGIDAITGLLHYGKNLTLVEFQGRMLPTQLDLKAASAYQTAFSDQGLKQYYETAIEEVLVDGAGAVEELRLSNGETIPCDMLIVAVGVLANVDFLEGSGVECDKFGLIFNQYGETNLPNIYGAGDVSGRMPIWPMAVKEGLIAASNMVGTKLEATDFFASKSTMNFLNIATLSLGTPVPEDDTYLVEIQEDAKGNYKKIIHKDGVICGAILQGDLSYAGILTQLIKEEINIEEVKKPIFDIDYSDFFQLTSQLQFKY